MTILEYVINSLMIWFIILGVTSAIELIDIFYSAFKKRASKTEQKRIYKFLTVLDNLIVFFMRK